MGSRPADEGATVQARGSSLVEAFATLDMRQLRLFASGENLLNVDWNEAQFATTSRLRDEAAPVTELHFTPGARRAMTAGVEVRF